MIDICDTHVFLLPALCTQMAASVTNSMDGKKAAVDAKAADEIAVTTNVTDYVEIESIELTRSSYIGPTNGWIVFSDEETNESTTYSWIKNPQSARHIKVEQTTQYVSWTQEYPVVRFALNGGLMWVRHGDSCKLSLKLTFKTVESIVIGFTVSSARPSTEAFAPDPQVTMSDEKRGYTVALKLATQPHIHNGRAYAVKAVEILFWSLMTGTK